MNDLPRHGNWIAVCDGSKALVFENKGSRFRPVLETRDVMRQNNPPAHLQGSSPPGRTLSSVGDRRAAMEEADLHTQAEETFLKAFGARLNQLVKEKGVRSLLIIAPARALGVLRTALSDATRQTVSGELVRDFVRLPLHEIERHLAEVE